MNPRTLVRDLVAAIRAKEDFTRNGDGVLHAYPDDVYKPKDELLVRQPGSISPNSHDPRVDA